MLFILLTRSDIATRPRVVHSYASKRCMGIRDNFTRLAVFNKKDRKSGNERFTGQVVARTAKKETRGTIHPKHEGKVHPVTRTRLTSFYSHVDIINRYFTKKRRRGVKSFYFYADPRVRQEMVVGPKGAPTRCDFITVKLVAYIL